jgi:membrane fusion protein, multidrug efflux system
MEERWRTQAGWPILAINVINPRPDARRAAIGPEPGRARAIRVGALGVLVAVWIVAAGCQQEGPATAAPKKPETGPSGPPRAVRVVAAAETSVARTVSATGTLAADEQFVLGTKVVGRLAEISVDLGTLVKQGLPIARIDVKDYQHRLDQAIAALKQARVRLGLPADGDDDRVDITQTAVVRQAKAQLDQAQLNRDRMARLWDQQLVARAELDAAVSAFQVADGRYQDALEEVQNRQGFLLQRRSEVDLARQQLADTAIVSPIDGAVMERQASVGQYLAAGAPVVTLVRLHPLRLRLSVPEREAASVRPGQPVRVTVEGDSAVHPGTVARLSPAIAEQSRTLLIEAEVPNTASRLRPGSFAKAEVVVQADERIVTVPATALITFAGVEKVLTVRDGKSEELRVTTGRRLGDRIEVVSGVKAGQPVVDPAGNLTGGQAVTVEK